jgi:hypothetical protein
MGISNRKTKKLPFKKTKSRSKSSRKSRIFSRRNKRGGNFDDVKDTLELNLRSKQANLSKMLNLACKNPDNCLALGYYGDIIKTFFDDFKNFSYVKMNEIKRIGTPSANGFILEIPFEKTGYKAYTVLKCSAKPSADNLFYEYYVGKYFINTFIKKFPCFVETYDCYEIKNESTWQSLHDNVINTTDLNSMLKLKKITETDYNEFGESCLKNKLLCVLIQHFDKFYAFLDEYRKNYENIKHEVLNILYQVYYPLVCLGKKYTHYDLHGKNVFLYKPYEGKQYIKMRYHRNGKVYEFPTEYIVKIIDYGRNYFKNNNTDTFDLLKNYICTSTKCAPSCGKYVGYNIIQGEIFTHKDNYSINPVKPNMSHDLRFANSVISYLKGINIFSDLVYNNSYGTPEKLNDNYKGNRTVYSIYDLLDSLENHINHWNRVKMPLKYDETWTCVAVMDIYDDGRDYTFNVIGSQIPKPPILSAPILSAPIRSAPIPIVPIRSAPIPIVPIRSAPIPIVPIRSAPIPIVPIRRAPIPNPSTSPIIIGNLLYFQGKKYLKSKDNYVYDYDNFVKGKKEIGKWNDITNKIVFNLDSLSMSSTKVDDNNDSDTDILDGSWL